MTPCGLHVTSCIFSNTLWSKHQQQSSAGLAWISHSPVYPNIASCLCSALWTIPPAQCLLQCLVLSVSFLPQ
jgi:hypothetical protein